MKKALTWIVVGLVVFYIVTNPVTAGEAIRDAVGSFATFFRTVAAP